LYKYKKTLGNDVHNLCHVKYIGNLISALFIYPMKDVKKEMS